MSIYLRRFIHYKFLAIGLFIISMGFQLGSAAIETTQVTADRDLSDYWRTTYDILVRPSQSRARIEEQYGLVEANSLSGIYGGITFDQYEEIKALPGVEVAAPIAMLGYIPERLRAADFGVQARPGFYSTSLSLEIDNGATVYSDVYGGSFFYVGKVTPGVIPNVPGLGMVNVNPHYSITSDLDLPFLMAGIDPRQEADLVGLDQALITGEALEASLTNPSYEQALRQALNQRLVQSEYLEGDASISVQNRTDPEGNPETIVNAPVLINATPYVQLKLRAELRRKVLPPEVASLEDIIARGGAEYLRSLPEETVAAQEMDSVQAYRQLAINLLLPNGLAARNPFPFPEVGTIQTFAASLPSPIEYQEAQFSFPGEDILLEILLPRGSDATGFKTEPAYRRSADLSTAWKHNRFEANFEMEASGVFDIERLPRPADVNRVPLETYYPPLAILRYDEEGNPVEPRTLNPTLNLAGYIQPPPLLLTTLDAAQLIAGENCISAIRVRVAGVDRLDPIARQKIEAVAGEIHRLTGLDVDIMVGSSPKRILVHVPEVGFVEEQWVQKGINTQIARSISQVNLFLFWVYAGVCTMFVLSTVLVSVLQRQREIGLLKALGWRSRTVFTIVIGEILLIGSAGALLGIGLSTGPASLLQLELSWNRTIRAFLFALAVSAAGGFFPVWSAARSIPAATLQMGQIIPTHKVRFLGGYILQSLLRRPLRSLVILLGQAVGSAMVVLILLAISQSQGYLIGTLTILGEYIQQHIEGYHYLMAALCLLLSALSLGDQMMLAVRDQSREIALLIAVGWRRREIFSIFIAQGLWLGLCGGMMGAIGAVVLFGLLYQGISLNGLWFGSLGVALSVATGGFAAWAPAHKATQTAPVETMRIGE